MEDHLASLSSISGVFAFVVGFGRSGKRWTSIALFLLAFYTTPSGLAGAAACFTIAIFANRISGLYVIGAFAFGLFTIITMP